MKTFLVSITDTLWLTDDVAKMLDDVAANIDPLETPANFFEHPSNYCGLAAVKSKRLAQKYRELCK